MRTFDLKLIAPLREIFLELTTSEQLETAILFSLGLSKREIALTRSVAYRTVEDALDNLKGRFNVLSLHELRLVCHVRLVLYALCKGVVKM